MKKLALIVFVCLAAWGVAAQSRADFLREQLLHNHKYVLVVAHRGDWRNHPENSLPAIEGCIEQGVDMVEIDLQRTQDGVLVLMHDATLDRTTNGHGRVDEHTFQEIADLRLKAMHSACLTRNHVPTLQEALELCRGRILINIDKGYQYYDEVLALAEKTGTQGQIVIKSGVPLAQLAQERPSALDGMVLNGSRAASGQRLLAAEVGDRGLMYMPVVSIDRPESAEFIAAFIKARPVAVECNMNEFNTAARQNLERLREAGIRIWVNSIWGSLCAGHDDDRAVELFQPDESWGWLLEQGASIIQSDRCAPLLNYLGRRGVRK